MTKYIELTELTGNESNPQEHKLFLPIGSFMVRRISDDKAVIEIFGSVKVTNFFGKDFLSKESIAVKEKYSEIKQEINSLKHRLSTGPR